MREGGLLGSTRLDELDRRILALLAREGRLSFREVARRLGVTTPTVSARVRALEGLGVLRGFHAEVDPASLPGKLHVVRVRTRAGAAERVRDAVAALPGASDVLVLAGGEVDARLRLPTGASLAALAAALDAVVGVEGYDVSEAVSGAPGTPAPLPADLDVRCHLCGGHVHEAVRARIGGRAHVFCCGHCEKEFRAKHARLSR